MLNDVVWSEDGVVSSQLLTQMAQRISPEGMAEVEELVWHGVEQRRRVRISILTSPSLNACDYYRAYMITKLLDRTDLFDFRYINELGPLDLYNSDVVIAFRPKAPELSRVQFDGKFLNCKMLVDYDDNIFNVMPSNFLSSNFTEADKQASIQITSGAAQLTVSTAILRGILEPYQQKVCVIPNLLDWESVSMLLKEYPKAEKRDYFTIGWAGTQSHLEDLMGHGWPYISAVMEFMDAHDDVRLWMMGMTTQELMDRYTGRIMYQPPTGLFQYLPCLASADLDLMTYPLIDHQFNWSKSNIRWLECSSIKVPIIAAHIPSYTMLGNKYCTTVPNTTEAWLEALEYAYANRDEMKQKAEDSYDYVRSEWTIQRRWPVWLALYMAVYQGKAIVGDFTPNPHTG